jgi:hypothetical protein
VNGLNKILINCKIANKKARFWRALFKHVDWLALRELEGATRLRTAVLLALDHA